MKKRIILHPSEVLDLLTSLVDKSLVMFDVSREGEGRYRLLETIRQYSQARLAETEEVAMLRGRHRDYFLALAEKAEPELQGTVQGIWLERLEAEHDNLCAALAWCKIDEKGAETGLRLAGALWRFWMVRGYLSAGRAHLAEALGREGATERTQVRAKALNGAGVLARDQGDYSAAQARSEESLAIYRELGNQGGIAFSLNCMGIAAQYQGNYGMARMLLEECLAIYRELEDKQGVAFALEAFARVAVGEDQPDRAVRLWGAAEALRKAIGSPLPSNQLEEYERNLTIVRAALSKEAFQAAWLDGRAMTMEHAIAYALEETSKA